MTSLERSLKQVTAFFQQERIPYMFIGGIANLIWGQPRLTQDLDVRHIIARQRDNLDREYLDPLVQELSRLLARSEIWAFYLKCWSK
ncbi:MAG: hypothetical protein H5U00_03190 [Clostridia bacterium]|nr:hypothetical protein [Clostridia bacterium]